jgi:hypothetical protein
MRRRNMYHATGLPGWMRNGQGAGGRGGRGMGPCGQFLMTGQWPNPAMAAASQGMPVTQAAPQQRLAFLQAKLNMLEQQLSAVQQEIAGMESGE